MLHVSWTVLESLGCLNVALQGRLQAFCRSAQIDQPVGKLMIDMNIVAPDGKNRCQAVNKVYADSQA